MKIRSLICLAFFSSGLILTSQIPAYVPQNGLNAFWPLNNINNANDIVASYVSNMYPPNVPPSLSNDRFGNLSGAYSFSGSNWIETPFKGILGDTSRAVSFWAKSPGNGGAGMYPVGWGGNGVGDRFGCSLDYPANKVAVGGANCSQIFSSPSQFSINQWHHYVFQFGREFGNTISDVKVWVDAVQIFTTSLNAYNPYCALFTVNNFNVTFGKIIYLPDPAFYNGSLDEIGIWKRILTQCEISKLYYADSNIGTMNFNPIGYSGSVMNLAQFTQTVSGNNQFLIPIVGGIYSGQGISFSSGQYNFNSPPTLSPGTYTITHTYTLQGGCVQVTTQTLALKGTTGMVSLNDEDEPVVNIFPIPTNTQFSITSNIKSEKFRVKISDMAGKIVVDKNVPLGDVPFDIDVSRFDEGIYLLEIHNNSNNPVIVKKLVIYKR